MIQEIKLHYTDMKVKELLRLLTHTDMRYIPDYAERMLVLYFAQRLANRLLSKLIMGIPPKGFQLRLKIEDACALYILYRHFLGNNAYPEYTNAILFELITNIEPLIPATYEIQD